MQDPVILIPVLLVVLIMTGCILAGLDHFDGEEDNSYPDHNGIQRQKIPVKNTTLDLISLSGGLCRVYAG